MTSDTIDTCSFCAKSKDDVAKLIVSDSVAICNECVELCQDLLTDGPRTGSVPHEIPDPRQLKRYLDQYIVGQDQAKITLSVSVSNHYKRLSRGPNDPDIAKANILMLGPTGSGKTLLARTIARYLDVPFVLADATSLTEAGYVGDDVEMMISRLYTASGNDIQRTQRGIVFVDEIDKIARKSESTSITRDVSGEGVQQALLKMVEGTRCRIMTAGNRRHPQGESVEVDTSEILFIAGGAFVGLEDIVRRRDRGSTMGFNGKLSSRELVDLATTSPDDLVAFGMIPEFVGRFPTTVALTALGRAEMRQVLTGVRNNLVEQYQWLFLQDNIHLEFTDDAIDAIVDRAQRSRTGARGLHAEIERVLMPHMFDIREYRDQGRDRLVIDTPQVNNPTTFQETQ